MSAFSFSVRRDLHKSSDTDASVKIKAISSGCCPFHPDVPIKTRTKSALGVIGLSHTRNECNRCQKLFDTALANEIKAERYFNTNRWEACRKVCEVMMTQLPAECKEFNTTKAMFDSASSEQEKTQKLISGFIAKGDALFKVRKYVEAKATFLQAERIATRTADLTKLKSRIKKCIKSEKMRAEEAGEHLPVFVMDSHVLLDSSFSMSGEKLLTAKTYIRGLYQRGMTIQDHIAVSNFAASGAQVCLARSRCCKDLSISEAVENVQATGMTKLYDAMLDAARTLSTTTIVGKRVLIVLTDGDDNSSKTSVSHLQQALLAWKVELFLIAIGKLESTTLDIMSSLCSAVDGKLLAPAVDSEADQIATALEDVWLALRANRCIKPGELIIEALQEEDKFPSRPMLVRSNSLDTVCTTSRSRNNSCASLCSLEERLSVMSDANGYDTDCSL